jgi:hypothetical protein
MCARAALSLFDWWALSEEGFEFVYEQPKSASSAVLMAVVGMALLGVISFLGSLRGRKLRLSRYVAYLLARLPRETRLTLVSLAYEEAKKLSSGTLEQQPETQLD